MKYFTIFLRAAISVIALSGIFSSCDNTQKPPAGKSSTLDLTEWTVMVYLNGDNNLERAAVQDLSEMANIGSSNQVNLIAQVDLIGVYYNIGWNDTRRFKITKGMDPIGESTPVMKIGEANMGDPKVLADFVSWSMQTYPAKKYALIIWDHGQGYRLLLANHALSQDAKKLIGSIDESRGKIKIDTSQRTNVQISVGDPFRSISNSSFKSCSNDETSNDELYNREIQDGLVDLVGRNKLDVLGFDACLMGMVETGYAMRNLTHNFVGSEELEPSVGWKYDDWIQKLENNPSIDGKDLAKLFVDSYSTYGESTDQTLSAVNLTGFEDVAKKISKLATTLQERLPTDLQAIKLARQDCSMYAPNPYQENPAKDYFFHVDFVQFCDRLIQRTQNSQLKSAAQDAKTGVLSSIIRNYRGNLRSGSYGSNGMAIYFPISDSQYKSDVFEKGGYKKDNKFFPVEFVAKEKWADFLHSYFRVVP